MRTDALAIATLEQYAVHLSHRQRILRQKNVPGTVSIQITGIAVCARAARGHGAVVSPRDELALLHLMHRIQLAPGLGATA
jgi:hypothetical protein